ncbi:MAG: serine/threonine-protein kinase [Trichodesmium sp. MO_231.B1]|nr:serine/threonine-protein kinase [Trichodesmium sp. MO_231.B1]
MNKYPDFRNYGYQISKELGCNLQGGRITYLAKSLTSNRQVVIKEFRFAIADGSWSAFKAYQREISALKQLKHSQIPCYLESFETESGFCLVTEYIHAPCLAERHIFTPEEVKQIAISVLEILVYLQNFQPPIIHRDIKPENILVDENLQVYLVDFGLARLQGGELALSSITAGTPGFMPPEEMFNRPLTTGSDLYSLGATLICLLTGTRSVEVDRLLDEDYRFKFEDLVPSLHWRFTKWLTKMVELHPKRRYENAVLALQELKEVPVVGGEEIFAFRENEVKVDREFVGGKIPVVGGRERFAFLEDEVRVNEKFIGVADKGEIFAFPENEVKVNQKFVGVLGIAAIVGILAGSIGWLGNSVNNTSVKKNGGSVSNISTSMVVGKVDVNMIIRSNSAGRDNSSLNDTSPLGTVIRKRNEIIDSDPKLWYLRSDKLCALYNDKNQTLAINQYECLVSNIKELQNTRECIACDLTRANLKNTNLVNANLQGSILFGADLRNANLKNANLKHTEFRDTLINDKTILDPKWHLVWQIVNGKYQGLNLKNADLSDAFLVGNLENIDLEGANLENTILIDSILVGANLKNANLKGAKFTGMSYVYLHDYLENPRDHDRFRFPHLHQANLENANLETAELIFSRLQDANLQGANLRKAKLAGANLDNTNLKSANLENAWLELAYLKNTNLENANLKNANLKNANLTGANIKGADFTGANLEGATMPDGSIYNGKIDK